MVVSTAKLTQKHQITIPTEVRDLLRLKAGDVVYLAVEGDQVRLQSLPGGWTEGSRGLGADLWKKEGGVAAIQAERDSWD